MSKKPDLWMPLYIADYLADTTHLSTEQHGAYLLLLMAAWKRGGSLPNDDAQLAAISRLDAARWRKHAPIIRAFFHADADDLVQGRLATEYADAVKVHEAQKANGAKGGRPKKETQQKPTGFDSLNPSHNPNETPSPSPTPRASVGSSQQAPEISQGQGTAAGLACRLMRQAGCAQTNPSHPDLIAALAAGVTPQALADTVVEGLSAGVRKPFAWAIATAWGRHAEGARPVVTGPPRIVPAAPLGKTAQAISALEEMKRGLAQNRTADRVPEIALLGSGSHPGG